MNMDFIENRRALVERYNQVFGAFGPLVTELQRQFADGEMEH